MQHAVPSTIAEIGFRSLYLSLLTWLLGVNSRAFNVPQRLLAAFLAGIMTVRGSVSSLAISKIAPFSHDALNRLVTGEPLRAFLQMLALSFIDKTKGKLVIDDTVMPKLGKLIQGVKWLYDSSSGKKVLALNVVLLGWTNGTLFIPLTFRIWKRPLDDKASKRRPRGKRRKGSPPVLAFDGTPFRTKIDLAIEMLHWAAGRGIKPEAVLFDAFYCASPLLKRLKKLGWHWVSRIKGNRVLERNGQPLKPEQWATMAKAGLAPRLSRSLRAELPGWGPVRIIAVIPKPGEEPRYLIGSNPGWKRPTIEQWYGERWAIEVSFRESNQLLGLKGCRCRSFQAQENYLALVLMAYVFLQYQKRPNETTGDTLDRLTLHPEAIATILLPPRLRPVKPERRHPRQSAPHARASGVAA
jgi:hypothetical protein